VRLIRPGRIVLAQPAHLGPRPIVQVLVGRLWVCARAEPIVEGVEVVVELPGQLGGGD
jgi:hypothetical protein